MTSLTTPRKSAETAVPPSPVPAPVPVPVPPDRPVDRHRDRDRYRRRYRSGTGTGPGPVPGPVPVPGTYHRLCVCFFKAPRTLDPVLRALVSPRGTRERLKLRSDWQTLVGPTGHHNCWPTDLLRRYSMTDDR